MYKINYYVLKTIIIINDKKRKIINTGNWQFKTVENPD